LHRVQIEELKRQIEIARPDFVSSQQKLIFKGKVLADDQTVADAGLQEKTFIVCMVKVREMLSAALYFSDAPTRSQQNVRQPLQQQLQRQHLQLHPHLHHLRLLLQFLHLRQCLEQRPYLHRPSLQVLERRNTRGLKISPVLRN
jgi:hypothetical protein